MTCKFTYLNIVLIVLMSTSFVTKEQSYDPNRKKEVTAADEITILENITKHKSHTITVNDDIIALQVRQIDSIRNQQNQAITQP